MAVCTYCSQLALFSHGPVLSCGCVGKEVKSTEKKKGRAEIGGVYLPSQLERTPQLCSWCRVKRGGRHPSPTRMGWIYHHDGMHARKWPLTVYFVLSRLWSNQREMERDLEIKKKKERRGRGERRAAGKKRSWRARSDRKRRSNKRWRRGTEKSQYGKTQSEELEEIKRGKREGRERERNQCN
jgi:hypothetical protein